jgi:hypothetical protein
VFRWLLVLERIGTSDQIGWYRETPCTLSSQ